MIRPTDRSSQTKPARPSRGATNSAHQAFDLGRQTAGASAPAAQPSLVPAELPRALESLEIRRQEIDEMIKRSLGGQALSAQQLLVWQAKVYDYSQRMDLFSRVVDRSLSAIKTTLNTQT